MSRTGKKIINIPDKVKVLQNDTHVVVEGPLGKMQQELFSDIEVKVDGNEVKISRNNDLPDTRSQHGLLRALLANMVVGVSQGFTKELDITGVGYRADVQGKVLNLSLGFSHTVHFQIPQDIEISVDKQTHIAIKGMDKVLVGQVAADIRKVRPPEPYKGKGVRYSDEKILRKAGKSAAGGKK